MELLKRHVDAYNAACCCGEYNKEDTVEDVNIAT